jgi:hypothetical protein
MNVFRAFRGGLTEGIRRKLGRRGLRLRPSAPPRFRVPIWPKKISETLNEFDGTHLVQMKVGGHGECEVLPLNDFCQYG